MLSRFLKKKPQLADRDGERYDVALRVLSRDLPDYRGVTLDLSRSGVQLETGALLEIGTEPLLKFEFDRGELDTFTCRAKVVWSKQEENSRSKFRSGLTFVPQTDDEKRQIARMATVLQTRSDTDLKTLLDQARRIDPDLERSFASFSDPQPVRAPAPVKMDASAPPPGPPQPKVPTAAPAAEPSKKSETPSSLGVYIPLNVMLEGYTWNRATRMLHIGLREGEQMHSLFFPDCQLFQVLEPAADIPIVGFYCAATSPATRKLKVTESQLEHRHYRFVSTDGKALVDVISSLCQPSAG